MENIMSKLADDYLNINEENKEAWRIKNDLSAEFALDKIREMQAEYNRFEMVALAKTEQIRAKLESERSKMTNGTEFFECKLREYFETVKTRDTKTLKKYSLPSGNLRLTKAKTTFECDKNKTLADAKKKGLNDYIKQTESFQWGEFKRLLDVKGDKIVNKDTGEIVELDGLSTVEKQAEFKVEV